MLIDVAVIKHVVIIRPRGGDAMINAVKAYCHANDHRHNGERVEEGGEKSGRKAEGQRQQHLAADPQQQTGKNKQQ